MKALARLAGLAGATCLLFASAAQADQMRGVVPAHGTPNAAAGGHRGGGANNNLVYHGGAVMNTNAVYAIYWDPSGSMQAGYQSVIDGFFSNVAAGNNASAIPGENVYFNDTQYYGPTGADIAYSSSFTGSITDTDVFPTSGCRDRYTSVCLTDGQLQQEIAHVMAVQHLTAGPGIEFFMFTARGVGSCYGSSCSFSSYCAYHSSFTSNGTEVLYANMPYAATVPSACGSGESPNGSDADSTINVTSHEHNETITDPLGTAWYDKSGNEIGDKCAWNFGTVLGGTSGAEYNQVIDGHDYFLQQEWSNAASGCVE